MAIYVGPLWKWQFKIQLPYMAILWHIMAIYGVHNLVYSILHIMLIIRGAQ